MKHTFSVHQGNQGNIQGTQMKHRWQTGEPICQSLNHKYTRLTIKHQSAHLGKEFDLLFMWRLLHSTTTNYSLCSKQIREKQTLREKVHFEAKCYCQGFSNHCTKMSDELLGDVHPFEKLLKKAVGKTLLNGGNVLLHVLQSPERGRE